MNHSHRPSIMKLLFAITREVGNQVRILDLPESVRAKLAVAIVQCFVRNMVRRLWSGDKKIYPQYYHLYNETSSSQYFPLVYITKTCRKNITGTPMQHFFCLCNRSPLLTTNHQQNSSHICNMKANTCNNAKTLAT